MDPRIVHSLVSAILFLVMASPAVYAVKSAGVKSADMSLVVRSVLVGLVTYLLMTMVQL